MGRNGQKYYVYILDKIIITSFPLQTKAHFLPKPIKTIRFPSKPCLLLHWFISMNPNPPCWLSIESSKFVCFNHWVSMNALKEKGSKCSKALWIQESLSCNQLNFFKFIRACRFWKRAHRYSFCNICIDIFIDFAVLKK